MLSTVPKIITIVNSQSYPKQMRTPNIFYFAATKLKYSLVARMPGLQHNSQIRTIFPATQLSGSFWIWIPTHSFHQEKWETGGFHEGLDHCIHYNIQGSTRLIYSSQSKARTLQSISKMQAKNPCSMVSLFSSSDTKNKFKQDNKSNEHTIKYPKRWASVWILSRSFVCEQKITEKSASAVPHKACWTWF